MASDLNLSDFVYGDTIVFSVLAKTPGETAADRSSLPSPGSAVMSVYISTFDGSASTLTFTSAGSEIALGDTDTARFDVAIPPASYTDTLREGRVYRYQIVTVEASGRTLTQRQGALSFRRSIAA